jgi:hypothetical protein
MRLLCEIGGLALAGLLILFFARHTKNAPVTRFLVGDRYGGYPNRMNQKSYERIKKNHTT